MDDTARPLDLEGVRRRLDGARGPEFWRTLEELADEDSFRALLEDEFPRQAAELGDGPLDRRKFLALLGASLALGGLGGCVSQAPSERIMPYVRAPEQVVPGRPLFFATAMPFAGYATGGLLVESHLGRPTKIEGNPDHPASPPASVQPTPAPFGPSDVYAQASILSLYDPDRSSAVRHLGLPSSWAAFETALLAALRGQPAERLRLAVLTETITSPTLIHQMRRLRQRFPQLRWHTWEPAGAGNARLGARRAFGRPIETQYRFAWGDGANRRYAERVLALDCDFLSCRYGPLAGVRDFMDRRRVWNAPDQRHPAMNRLYVAESELTGTGAKADHRVALRSGQIEGFARAVAAQLGVAEGAAGRDADYGLPERWIQELANDLREHARQSVVLVGPGQPPAVHALAQAMNHRLDNFGTTVMHTAPIAALPIAPNDLPDDGLDEIGSLRGLTEAMRSGAVDVLLILGANPVYTAPVGIDFAAALDRVPLRIHQGLAFDETAAHCHWHLPEAHYLESWGDVRAHDGTVSLIQPLIAPLYQGRSAIEVVELLLGTSVRTGHEIVRSHWRAVMQGADALRAERASYAELPRAGDFEGWWQRSLNRGFIAGTHAPRLTDLPAPTVPAARPAAATTGLEVVFRPDPSVFDGRFANNAWLQELPRPLSKITWDNVAMMSPETARALRLVESAAQAHRANGRRVRLTFDNRTMIDAPVWVQPGHADGTVTLTLGYGRTQAGRVGSGIGYNAYRLRPGDAAWFATGLTVTDTGATVELATTQHQHLINTETIGDRELVHSGPVQRYAQLVEAGRRTPEARGERRLSLYPEPHPSLTDENQWGMTIDQTACVGCQACVVACQSENNIPVVGKEETARGRNMLWLRIDSYHRGDPLRPEAMETYFQPRPCMHCENAPCELVCPVGATVHSADGLNDMVYNRCVGTRYCSNNCPYKVRRFNFLQYTDFATPHEQPRRNPDVTVRSRGVMEKCTYCVQRIRGGQIQAQLEGRPIRDGEIMTACQAACPAGAILFGDLGRRTDPGRAAGAPSRDELPSERRPTRVAQAQAHPLSYGLLQELNTQPRTKYLWAVRNPNPAIEGLQGRRG